jgi:3-oxoacyl-[acyl-carrier-protein] synthase-1
MIDTAGEPMRIARAPWLDVGVEGIERHCALLFPAIDEAISALLGRPDASEARIGFGLGLPPARPGGPESLRERLVEAVADRYGKRFVSALVFEVGHAAAHLSLDAAIKACAADSVDAFVVAGVDSYLAPETLEWVEECDQLHGGGPLNNAWGFVPGEAAGAMLVCDPALARAARLESLGEIIAVGIGSEKNLIKTESVCIGEGLTEAFRGALSALATGDVVHNVFCDLNGETYRADEYGFAALRTGERFRAATDFVAPADCWGDIGAAGVPLHAALAVICQRKRYGKGPISMVWASSESGERGAAVIRGFDDRGS